MEIIDDLPLDLQKLIINYIPNKYMQLSDSLMNKLLLKYPFMKKFKHLGIIKNSLQNISINNNKMNNNLYYCLIKYSYNKEFIHKKEIYFGLYNEMRDLYTIINNEMKNDAIEYNIEYNDYEWKNFINFSFNLNDEIYYVHLE